MPWLGRQPSSPPVLTGINSVPRTDRLRVRVCSSLDGRWGSKPQREAFWGSTADAGSSSPARMGCITRRTRFPRAGSYRTTSCTDVPSTRPLPRPSTEGMATDARDSLPTACWSPTAPEPSSSPRLTLTPARETSHTTAQPSIPSPALPVLPLPWMHTPHARSSLKCTKLHSMNNQLRSAVVGTFFSCTSSRGCLYR